MDFRISSKGCGHPGLVATCAPEGKVEGFKKVPLEELWSCPGFAHFYTFASGFVCSWVLTLCNFVPYIFHFVLHNKHFSMFLNS